MKKLILTISIFFTLISLAEARECKSGDIKGDAFIYSDGKKVTVIKGTDIPNPENKIIMIYNTGGWTVKKKWGECKDFLPKQLGEEETKKICSEIISKVGASSVKDMGKVMGELKKNHADTIDFSKAGQIIKNLLNS